MAHPSKPTDIIIIGAGLNGLAAAVAFAGTAARIPLNVVLADAGDPAKTRTAKFDGRSSAITASSRHMLEALGLWQAIAPHAEAMRDIIVTDSKVDAIARPALLQFDDPADKSGVAAHMVENRHLYTALLEAAETSPQITISRNCTISGYAFEEACVRLATTQGKELTAALAVAADGVNSPAREAARIDTVGWSYSQSAITLTVEHEKPHNGRAEENFLPAGPFAILPLPGNRSSLVWTEETSDAKRIMELADSAFATELTRRFGSHLGKVSVAGPRHCFPLGLKIARQFVAKRLALIGDAAHVVHPLAGLGFNLGLRDIAALAETVAGQARLGLDIGSPDALERYQRWRRSDTMMVAVATDVLNRLFSNDTEALRQLRDFGLGLVDQVGFVKDRLIGQAAGASGNLPKLLRGEPV